MKKRIVTVLCGSAAVVMFGLATAFAHSADADGKGAHKESGEGKATTIVGELIDTACFMTSDGDAKGKDHADCATKCMASGVPAGIYPEGAKDADEALFLLTNPQVLAQYASQTIKVEGDVYEHRHSIDVKKLYVKDGAGWKEVALKDAHHGMGSMMGDDKKDADMKGMDMSKDAHQEHKH